MALTSKLQLIASARLTATQDLGEAQTSKLLSLVVDLTDGTTAGKADRIFTDTRTLAVSATEDLDLSGVLTDPFGAVLTFARVKGLYIVAAAGNTNNVVVGAAVGSPWAALLNTTGTLTLRPGAAVGVACAAADATGYVVGAGTADLLKVANSGAGTSVDYSIMVIGASA